MKKSFLILATAALFAACSNEKALTIEQPIAQQQANDNAVIFDAYLNRTLTRAGATGEQTTTTLQTSGFGVFGYYTNNEAYSQYATPNFMYNQKVEGASWTYSPVKYWPNEYGTDAKSDDVDKVTFFAYAPYVDVTPTSGIPFKLTTTFNKTDAQIKVLVEADVKTEWETDNAPLTWDGDATDDQKEAALAAGVAAWKTAHESDPTETTTTQSTDAVKNITAITRNTAVGDPIVKYVVDTDPATSVDLLWGVQPKEDIPSYAQIQGTWTANPGFPYLDLIKDVNSTPSKVKFNFRHALAKLNVQIDAFVDGTDATNSLADGTKIYVRSITFTGIAMKGALNLNNGTENYPYWLDYEGKNEIISEEYTFYDGRKDGKEATQNGEQRSELPCMLNPEIIQTSETTNGVTNTAQNLFLSGTATDPIYVIPTTDAMNVTIVYDVETEDDKLATYLADGTTHGSSIENRIYQETIFGTFEAGKAYTLKLHLGMTSVKFDAEVATWDAQTAEDVDLPENK